MQCQHTFCSLYNQLFGTSGDLSLALGLLLCLLKNLPVIYFLLIIHFFGQGCFAVVFSKHISHCIALDEPHEMGISKGTKQLLVIKCLVCRSHVFKPYHPECPWTGADCNIQCQVASKIYANVPRCITCCPFSDETLRCFKQLVN